jgi:hypothetical protein
MRGDLLEAKACVDWAMSNLPAFETRLEAWLDDNIEIAFRDAPPPATHDIIVAFEKDELPLAFSVEAGAYINAIRSSLDVLACVVGKREAFLEPDNIYFPIAGSLDSFTTGDYPGSKFIKNISADHRLVFEKYKPYKGGNDDLWSCHQLDITRKHKRLLGIYLRAARSWVTGYNLRETFQSAAVAFIPGGPGETILGLLLKGAPRPQVNYTARVCFNEAAAAMPGAPVVPAMRGFARIALDVINAFDF